MARQAAVSAPSHGGADYHRALLAAAGAVALGNVSLAGGHPEDAVAVGLFLAGILALSNSRARRSAEAQGARAGLAAFIRLIQGRRLTGFLDGPFPFGRPAAPAALPDRTAPLLEVAELRPGHRATW
jgi:hypothetical protein